MCNWACKHSQCAQAVNCKLEILPCFQTWTLKNNKWLYQWVEMIQVVPSAASSGIRHRILFDCTFISFNIFAIHFLLLQITAVLFRSLDIKVIQNKVDFLKQSHQRDYGAYSGKYNAFWWKPNNGLVTLILNLYRRFVSWVYIASAK